DGAPHAQDPLVREEERKRLGDREHAVPPRDVAFEMPRIRDLLAHADGNADGGEEQRQRAAGGRTAVGDDEGKGHPHRQQRGNYVRGCIYQALSSTSPKPCCIFRSNSSATRASLSSISCASVLAYCMPPSSAYAACTLSLHRPMSRTVGTMRLNRRLRKRIWPSELSSIFNVSLTSNPSRSHISGELKRTRRWYEPSMTNSSRSRRSAAVSSG